MLETQKTATKAEFARILNVRKSYVHKLEQEGRLVLTDNGRVMVTESRERIAQTRDPSRAGLADQWATPSDTGTTPAPKTDAEPHRMPSPPVSMGEGGIGSSYQAARAIKEKYLALQARRDYEQDCGLLMEAAAVKAMLADAITTLRTNAEAMPVTLGPLLAAERDEGRCIAILRDHVEHMLSTLAAHFQKIASASEDVTGIRQ
jgi:hypothetical protein